MADENSKGYQEALRRIKENLKTKDNELDLSGLGLTEVPTEIEKLSHLKHLDLGRNIVNNKENKLNTFPREILKLKNLEKLYLDRTQIDELPKEISELKNLKFLNIGNTLISVLPIEISALKNLTSLSLGGTQIREFPKEISELKNLQELSLSDTQISELPKEISELKNLKTLFLENTKISKLPKEILELKKLFFLSVDNTQLNLPPEIAKDYTQPQAVLNYYFENIVGKDRPLNEIKMLLLGEGEVGKTALVHRLVEDKFVTTGKTEGIDIHKWNVEIKKNCNIQINIWDFAGQEITHATHQFFLTRRSIYLLVLASRGDEKSNRLEEWLKIIQNLGGESPVILVCNKSDEHQMNLDERALREKYPNIREIIKVSCKKGTNIKTLKQKILKEIKQMPHVFDPFSKKWFTVKQRLENLKENYIPFEDYLKICEEEEVIEDIDRETLIKFLHDLGVVLNFRDDRRLNDTNVLKPEWITEGVYKILTSKTLDDKHGVLTLEMVGKILDNRRYPKHKHEFIVKMMQKFERCFPLEKPETYLVPDLLPKQQPDFGDWTPEETGLGFQYHYEIEPGSFITRFIVNMNEYIDGETYWRKGVVLTNGKDNRALIKTDLEDKIIFIWIDGKLETRRGFLSIIRRQFEKIHQTMSNLKVTEYVQHEKGLIAFEDLITLEEEGIKEHFFPNLRTKIHVNKLLNGIEGDNERAYRFAKSVSKNLLEADRLLGKFKEKTQYDVALSFAGEDRDFVEKVYQELSAHDASVFYDSDEKIAIDLWAKDLIEELDDVYRKRSKYVVIFVSEGYAEKEWTKLERKSALARALREKSEYILPARFDDTELPGLLPTVAFIDLRNETPQSFARKILKKLGKL
jgi:internalin A